eukprot:COSAG01_NODE_443_length_17009_cov_20.575163_8_plen_78_part_00
MQINTRWPRCDDAIRDATMRGPPSKRIARPERLSAGISIPQEMGLLIALVRTVRLRIIPYNSYAPRAWRLRGQASRG